jgi:RNase P subunit RPR2
VSGSKKQHVAHYVFTKGKVVLTCSCGRVRRYPDERTARSAFGSHVAAETKRHQKEVA